MMVVCPPYIPHDGFVSTMHAVIGAVEVGVHSASGGGGHVASEG